MLLKDMAGRIANNRNNADEYLIDPDASIGAPIPADEELALLAVGGAGAALRGRLLIWNALEMSFLTVKVPRNRECPVCGDQPTITELIDGERSCDTG